jgi:hypothetical protein
VNACRSGTVATAVIATVEADTAGVGSDIVEVGTVEVETGRMKG